MAINVGTTTASLYLGSTPVAAYLGTEQVYSAASVPGAPTIDSAEYVSGGATDVFFFPPENDGGSAITGYKFYFDDVEVTPSTLVPIEGGAIFAPFAVFFSGGQSAQVSAVNAIGEGPKSAPVTVVSA
jgi:hypothetical protein